MEPLLNLKDLLTHEVEDLYSAEEQIIEALPAMQEKASDQELKKAIAEHLRVTKEQKKRLDKVKSILSSEEESEEKKGLFERIFGSNTKCKGTEGLIKEGEKIMGQDMDPKVMDAAIIAAAQKIEHYEISGYGTARAFASELGLTEVARLLETTLNEEYKADDLLTSLATGKINLEAENGNRNNNGRSNGKTGRSANGKGTAVRSGAAKPVKAAKKKTASKSKGATKKSAAKKGKAKPARARR